MAYYVLTRVSEDAQTWDEVIDQDQSWKKGRIVKKIFMSMEEAQLFIEEKASLPYAECFCYRNEKLHKITEIE